jgi:trehalose 6-phosphate phosphatase
MMNQSEQAHAQIDLDKYEAAIFDMDGVVTETARAHNASWKRMFDAYLKDRTRREGETYKPFEDDDYYRYVDGNPRYEGAASFLESRGIDLPYGSPDDAPDKETVCGLGNRKNKYFHKYLKENGADFYESTVEFIGKLKSRNISTAVISSSRNAKAVLSAAGVQDIFQATIDGVYAAEHDLKGKPEPDIFLEAAGKLNVRPEKTMVIEDAVSGVEAGKRGDFGLVIGIDRSGNNPEIRNHSADIVLSDLSEIWSGRLLIRSAGICPGFFQWPLC